MKATAPPPAERNGIDSETISLPDVVRISELSEGSLRSIAAQGYFPNPTRRIYFLLPTVRGLLRYYREKDAKRTIQETYPTLENCASATGIPIGVLKSAKRGGCSAFRGNHVYLAVLIRWLFEKPDKSPIDIEDERARFVGLQNQKMEVEVAKLRGDLVPVEEVERLGADLGSVIRGIVARLHRLAPLLAGLPVPEIEKRLREKEEEILAQLHRVGDRVSRWNGRKRKEEDGKPRTSRSAATIATSKRRPRVPEAAEVKVALAIPIPEDEEEEDD